MNTKYLIPTLALAFVGCQSVDSIVFPTILNIREVPLVASTKYYADEDIQRIEHINEHGLAYIATSTSPVIHTRQFSSDGASQITSTFYDSDAIQRIDDIHGNVTPVQIAQPSVPFSGVSADTMKSPDYYDMDDLDRLNSLNNNNDLASTVPAPSLNNMPATDTPHFTASNMPGIAATPLPAPAPVVETASARAQCLVHGVVVNGTYQFIAAGTKGRLQKSDGRDYFMANGARHDLTGLPYTLSSC